MAGFEFDRPYFVPRNAVSRSAPFAGFNAACCLRRQLSARAKQVAVDLPASSATMSPLPYWGGPVAHEHFQPSVRQYQDLSSVFEICVMFVVGPFVSGTNVGLLRAPRRPDVAAHSTILKPSSVDAVSARSFATGVTQSPPRRRDVAARSTILKPSSVDTVSARSFATGVTQSLPPTVLTSSPRSLLIEKRFVRRVAPRIRKHPSGCASKKKPLPALVWDAPRKDKNRLAHALNGNTAMAPARQLDASPITPSTDTSDGWSCHLCQRKYSTARQLVRHWKDVEGLLVDQIKSWYPYTVYSEERLVGTKRIVMSDLEREHVLPVPKKNK